MLTKLTRADGTSKHGSIHWAVGKTVEVPFAEQGQTLCRPGLLHVYEGGPELAALLDPIHADLGPGARCFEVEGVLVVRDSPLKAGGHSFYVLRELALPVVTPVIAAWFAIHCAHAVHENLAWLEWSMGWLSGQDRSPMTAACASTMCARSPAARAASRAAASKTQAAAEAAEAAAWAVDSAPGLDLNSRAIRAFQGDL